MAKNELERAKVAFFRKRYNDVITLLEPKVIQYRDSFQFYYFLGLACLHSGDVGGATSYFQRARQIKLRDPDLLTALAALFLRRGDTHQAVEYYLEALEYAPEHRLAKRALEFIRKNGDRDTLSDLVETGKITRFYPHPTFSRNYPLLVIVVLACFIGFFALQAIVPRIQANVRTSARADLSSIQLAAGERSGAVELGGSYRYILTDNEVIKAYNAAHRYFQTYHDNAAQLEINRLLYSNASASIKQKARLLMTYLEEPGFDTIKDSYPYLKVVNDPYLYLDCWIVWKGMATNIRTTDNTLDFDFLVGYDTRSTLDGIVPVHYQSVISIDPDKPLQILARITLENGKLALIGGGVFQSSSPAVQ